MRVLVTGGAGFIGSHVADALLTDGHEVAVLDNLLTGHRENVPDGARFYELDLRDDGLADVFADFCPEVVSHHAAQMSVRVSIDDPRLDASINTEGGVHLLERAVAAGVRKVIYASTGGAIYGEPAYLPCDEGHPIAPLCQYGVSKHTFEQYLGLYARLYGIDYTVLRYPNVYGPRQDPAGEAGVVSIFAGQMLRGLPSAIYGTGEQERDFVYVDDVARATLAALARGSRQVINLGSGKGTSVRAIHEALSSIIGCAESPEYRPARLGEVNRIFLTGNKAADELGWAAGTSLRAGLEATVAWLRLQAAASPEARPLAAD